jgi:hypothetical protein
MKRWFGTLLIATVCSAVVHADVTIVQTTTIEGGMAAMGGQNPSPTITHRIKGQKARTDVDVPTMQMATIADLATKQVILLRPDQKTAQVVGTAPPGAGAAPAGPAPKVDMTVTPTGRSQVIDGITCTEYAFTTSMDMSEMAGPSQMPPEAADMMKAMKMNMKGSLWMAKEVPGAAEFIAFQKAANESDLASAIARASGMNLPGMSRMSKAMAGLNGMAYLTEINLTVEGTGQMAEMMQQMGAMKVTTKVTSVNTDPLADDLFKIPAGYTTIK